MKPELAPKLQRYREECFKVLWREFQADLAQRQQQSAVARSPLAQVREMGLAIAQLAEQQMALEGRVHYVEGTRSGALTNRLAIEGGCHYGTPLRRTL